MILYALLLLLTLGVGFGLVWLIWNRDSSWRAMLLRLALGLGAGIGVVSILFFLSKLVGWPAGIVPFLTVLAVVAILLLVGAAWRTGWKGNLGLRWPGRTWKWLWFIPLGLALAIFINTFLGMIAYQPDGEWDAWAIWNNHARFMFEDGSAWLRLFDPALYWSHPDYPLLTPGYVALSWKVLGRITTLAPVGLAALFALGTLGTLFSGLNYRAGFSAASLAAIILLLIRPFVNITANLYADVPLAFAILAASVTLYFYLEEGKSEFAILSGLFCGLAAWTKNEGWSLLVAVFTGLSIAALVNRRVDQRAWRGLGYFALGAAPVLLVVFYFKLGLAPGNDLFAGQSSGALLAAVMDVNRWGMIAGGMLDQFLFYGFRIFILLVLFGFIAGSARRLGLPQAIGWTVLGLIVAQYFVIFLITPHDLDWHLDTTLERLVTHIFPAILFLGFSWVNLRKS
jgi:hypothetical protein